MDIEEPTQIKKIKKLAAIMEKIAKRYNNRLKSKMKEWIESHVRQNIGEI